MMMVSRVQQAFTSTPSIPPSDASLARVDQLQEQLDNITQRCSKLDAQCQQVKGYAVYYQNLYENEEKKLQEALVLHENDKKDLDDKIKKVTDELDELQSKYETETEEKLRIEQELKIAKNLIECIKGRRRTSSVDSIDTDASYSSELTRANEMLQVLRNQLKKSEDQLANRSVTSEDHEDTDGLSYDDKFQALQEYVEKLKVSRRRKIDQITHLCEALNVASTNQDELRANLLEQRTSNKKKSAKIDLLKSEKSELLRQLENLESEIEEKRTEIERDRIAWKERLEQLESNHVNAVMKMREIHADKLADMDAKVHEIRHENQILVKQNNQQRDDDNKEVCDQLRQALECLEKLEVKCAYVEDQNRSLRDQLDRFEVVRHEEATAMQSEISKCETQLMNNQQTINNVRTKNFQLLDQVDQERRARENCERQLEEIEQRKDDEQEKALFLRRLVEAEKEAREKDKAEQQLEAENLRLRIVALETDLRSRDDVIKQLKTRADQDGKLIRLSEQRIDELSNDKERCHGDAQWFYNELQRVTADAGFFHHEAGRYYHNYMQLNKKYQQLQMSVKRSEEKDKSKNSRLFDGEKSERLDKILEGLEDDPAADDSVSSLPQSPAVSEDFKPGDDQTSTPMSKKPPIDPNQQTTRSFRMELFTPPPDLNGDEKSLTKRERRIAKLRKLPIWRGENPDNPNADLSFCEVSSSDDDCLSKSTTNDDGGV